MAYILPKKFYHIGRKYFPISALPIASLVPQAQKRLWPSVSPSVSGGGRIRTVDLGMIRRRFYHYATAVTALGLARRLRMTLTGHWIMRKWAQQFCCTTTRACTRHFTQQLFIVHFDYILNQYWLDSIPLELRVIIWLLKNCTVATGFEFFIIKLYLKSFWTYIITLY